MAIYYAACSLDGFLADDRDSVAFLDQVAPPEPSSYASFIEGIGAIAMGRATYEFILRHMEAGGQWPYEQPCWVFTHQSFPPREGVTFVQGPPEDALPAMQEAAGDKQIWVAGGGELAGRFYDAGLLDALIINIAARTLGSGKPVFPRDATLEIIQATPMGKGFVEVHFRPVPKTSN